jgi:N-acetylmuramoyl-L-alanine amidase
VRVAFTLTGDKHVDVLAADGMLALTVTNTPETAAVRIGTGEIGGAAAAQNADPYMPGTPGADASPAAGSWKFGTQPSGNRVIVIDPGHGGGDAGTAHNGLVEKQLTFEIAQRLRPLLAAQGWIVKFTRDGDVDPVSQANLDAFAHDGKPNANDRAYLQTRCDVANASNARMFISIHVNYAESSAPHGTTFYYTKPQDLALAQALERSVIQAAATKDDGVVHNDFYVTKHTTMPAVLIETAFISNPGDAALLASPDWLQQMATGIAAGVRAYAGAQPVLSSKIDR